MKKSDKEDNPSSARPPIADNEIQIEFGERSLMDASIPMEYQSDIELPHLEVYDPSKSIVLFKSPERNKLNDVEIERYRNELY